MNGSGGWRPSDVSHCICGPFLFEVTSTGQMGQEQVPEDEALLLRLERVTRIHLLQSAIRARAKSGSPVSGPLLGANQVTVLCPYPAGLPGIFAIAKPAWTSGSSTAGASRVRCRPPADASHPS